MIPMIPLGIIIKIKFNRKWGLKLRIILDAIGKPPCYKCKHRRVGINLDGTYKYSCYFHMDDQIWEEDIEVDGKKVKRYSCCFEFFTYNTQLCVITQKIETYDPPNGEHLYLEKDGKKCVVKTPDCRHCFHRGRIIPPEESGQPFAGILCKHRGVYECFMVPKMVFAQRTPGAPRHTEYTEDRMSMLVPLGCDNHRNFCAMYGFDEKQFEYFPTFNHRWERNVFMANVKKKVNQNSAGVQNPNPKKTPNYIKRRLIRNRFKYNLYQKFPLDLSFYKALASSSCELDIALSNIFSNDGSTEPTRNHSSIINSGLSTLMYEKKYIDSLFSKGHYLESFPSKYVENGKISYDKSSLVGINSITESKIMLGKDKSLDKYLNYYPITSHHAFPLVVPPEIKETLVHDLDQMCESQNFENVWPLLKRELPKLRMDPMFIHKELNFTSFFAKKGSGEEGAGDETKKSLYDAYPLINRVAQEFSKTSIAQYNSYMEGLINTFQNMKDQYTDEETGKINSLFAPDFNESMDLLNLPELKLGDDHETNPDVYKEFMGMSSIIRRLGLLPNTSLPMNLLSLLAKTIKKNKWENDIKELYFFIRKELARHHIIFNFEDVLPIKFAPSSQV